MNNPKYRIVQKGSRFYIERLRLFLFWIPVRSFEFLDPVQLLISDSLSYISFEEAFNTLQHYLCPAKYEELYRGSRKELCQMTAEFASDMKEHREKIKAV